MPTSSDDLSIINDNRFLEELDGREVADARRDRPGHRPRTQYADAFDALESGLPVGVSELEPSAAPSDKASSLPWHEPPVARPASQQRRVPVMAAAFVLLVGLTVGGATAAIVFHDRVAQITASWASRWAAPGTIDPVP
ncbi:MAG: hypothetical protein ACRD2I_23205 [Vicinamibacterales bacterium]